MPKGDDNKFRQYYNEDPKFYSSEFKAFLNSFSGKDFKNANGQYMNSQEKDCWEKYKGQTKEEDTEEQDLHYDVSQLTEKDCAYLQNPSNIAANLGTFEWACKTETTFDYIGKDQEGNAQVTTWVAPSVNIYNLINSIYKEYGILGVYSQVGKVVEKRLKDIEKEKAKQDAKEDGNEKDLEGAQDEKGDGKGKKVVVTHEKDGSSRTAMIEETREEIQELTGEVERVGREEVLETREEYGMVEQEPEELTNFRSQEEDGLALETDALEEEMQRIQDINN
ncbi:MAG: hypothetical protein E7341_03475 [Clostridiales bacterium]|nr:hypothetical protein [Clostridiales bacterium]